MKTLSVISYICVLLAFTNYSVAQNNLHIINTFHISGPARWDYIKVGPVNGLLYVSHGTQVNVLNKNTGDSVAVILNTIGVHGITFDSVLNKGFISDGRSNSVTVFDMNTNKIIDQIATGNDPDAIFYEPFSKKIIACNGHTKYIDVIDPVSDKLIDSINVGGSPEEAVSDGQGNLYVNLEDMNAIARVDMKRFKLIATWSLSPAEGPTGLAIDRSTKRLFAGCDKKLVVINALDGKIVDTIPIGDGCDGTAFDPYFKNIYASCGDGTLSVIHEESSDKFTTVQTVITKRGARTLALDKDTHLIYLPTAEFEPRQPGETGRPKTKEGTFQVLVVGR